ncbi:MAG: L-rhamnose isomerase [Bacillota bacterium]
MKNLEHLAEKFPGFSMEGIIKNLMEQHIETPSWGYGSGGTRFFTFKDPTAARNLEEKIADAAVVHQFTGVTPSVALHIPWDKTDDWKGLAAFAAARGIRIGAINPNLFQDNDYMNGSITNLSPAVRKKAVAHIMECVEIMNQTGSRHLSLWFADGTNYPGQGDFRKRKALLIESLREVYGKMSGNQVMLIEYKMFEPAFYHTDIGDWGMATFIAQAVGDRAMTLVDLGHHPLGANIEQIVAWLIDLGRLGGFHFNSKKYADDDLTVGSINPYELFLIYCELIKGYRDAGVKMDVAYMIDQSHFDKPKVEGMIQSVDNIQTAYAKALLVDYEALAQSQANGDAVLAEEILKKAFQADVQPLLAEARTRMGVDPDLLSAYRRSPEYKERILR